MLGTAPMVGSLTFGEYVRRLRRQKKWQFGYLAAATRLSPTHLSRIENDNAMPTPDTVVRLAEALGGDLELLLELANCLPREILERLTRRVQPAPEVLRRAATDEPDPGFARALVEEIDPTLREGLAAAFSLSASDVDGIFAVLQRIAAMPPEGRRSVIEFLASYANRGPAGEVGGDE